MAYLVTHSAFRDIHAKVDLAAGSLVMRDEARAADMIRRLTACGATDAVAVELTSEQHQALVASRLPPMGR